MTEHRTFAPSYSLAQLAAALSENQGLNGPLVGIGHQAGATIGSFDETGTATGTIILKPGQPMAVPPGQVIDTDTVYVLDVLQTVTAYRSEPPTQPVP